eukprot:14811596-Alexandrium_andersonii.AAC.1
MARRSSGRARARSHRRGALKKYQWRSICTPWGTSTRAGSAPAGTIRLCARSLERRPAPRSQRAAWLRLPNPPRWRGRE